MPAVPDLERIDDMRLGHLERAAFDHDDRILASGDHEVHVRVLELLERRVEHPLVLHPTNADAGNRAGKRDLRCVEGERRREQREHVGVVLLVGRDHVDEDLDLVLEPSGNSGRIDRSMMRAERISASCGRPSRLMKPPGILPAA